MSVSQHWWRQQAALCLGLLAFFITLCLGAVAGYSLNLLLTSTMGVALVVPAFACYCRALGDALWIAGASAIAVLGGWLCVGHGNLASGVPLLLCTAVFAGLVWAQISLCRLLVRWRTDPILAAAVVTVLGLTWLAWPLWTTTAPPLYVRVHPLLAMNGVVSEDFGIWTEQPIAYPWIALGQDVSYRLPASPWPSVAFHFAVGVGANLMLPWWRRGPRKATHGETAPTVAGV